MFPELTQLDNIILLDNQFQYFIGKTFQLDSPHKSNDQLDCLSFLIHTQERMLILIDINDQLGTPYLSLHQLESVYLLENSKHILHHMDQ